MNTWGRGRFKVWLKKQKIGEELVYTLGGGETPHIGAVSVCEPGKKPRSVRLPHHLDYLITEPIAKAAAKKYGVKAVCVGGVHVDDASREEIKKLVKNCRELKRFV
ncbi:MAG: hypothetical protein KAW41_05270 [Candidatus Diapherotrites archaeon]|nr:hypothetical protein [Candidatus Diapherotrites archaeon]